MKIYCLGDSLTTGYGVSGSDCGVHCVAVKTGFDMINAGLNGDVTLGMAARFYRDTESMRPDLMFLLGGGNDILNERTDKNARKGITRILDAADQRSIPVVLGLPFTFVPDMAERLWSPDKDYDLINDIQERYVHWLTCGLYSPLWSYLSAANFPWTGFTSMPQDIELWLTL